MPALSISWIIPACPSSTCLCDLKPPHNLCTRFHENMIMIKSEFRNNSIIKCEVNHSWATGSCLSPINLVHVWRVLQPSISLPIFDIVILPLTVNPVNVAYLLFVIELISFNLIWNSLSKKKLHLKSSCQFLAHPVIRSTYPSFSSESQLLATLFFSFSYSFSKLPMSL